MPNYDIDDAIRALSTSAEDIHTDIRILGEQWGRMKERLGLLEAHELEASEIGLVLWALKMTEDHDGDPIYGDLPRRARELHDLLLVRYDLTPDETTRMWAERGRSDASEAIAAGRHEGGRLDTLVPVLDVTVGDPVHRLAYERAFTERVKQELANE